MTPDNAPTAPREGLGRLVVKLYRYRSLVKRHWWILALTVSLGLAYEGWMLYQKPRLFESTSQLNIREELALPTTVVKVSSDNNFVGTQLTMLTSAEVAERARQRVALEFPQLQGATPAMAATVIPRTQIFNVTGTGPDPAYTQKFVDANVAAFVEQRREIRDVQLNGIGASITDLLARAKIDLEKAKADLQEFVKKNRMPYWQELGKNSASTLANLKTRQAMLQTELTRLQKLTADQLLAIPPAQNLFNPPAPSGQAPAAAGALAGEANGGGGNLPLTSDLYSMYLLKSQELSDAQRRYEDGVKIWKPKHPSLIAIKDEIAMLEKSIENIKEQNRSASAQRKDAIIAELASLEESIKTWEGKVLESSAKDAEYQTYVDAVTRATSAYDSLANNKQAVNQTPATDVFMVLQKASTPTEVPKGTAKHLIMGLVGGLVIGMLILALLDRADDRMTSSSEILEQFSEPILGQIPNVAESRGEAGLPLLQVDDERYTYSEAFRSLRSSLIFMPNQTELRTILITSAIPNEGKSTIASNLAITMAAAGANVALVDADLRRGDLASLFDMDGRTGLSNVLRGEVPWQSAIQETRYPHLSLIPRGPVTMQSSELLLLPTIHTLLDGLRENYDLIIFNTAPILATDDTPSLSPNFDGTLMVMRAQFTSARLTQNSLNALYQRQVNVLGLVLNCVDTEMPDYYYYRYPKYYATS